MKHGERETRKANIFVPVPNLIVTQTNCSGCRRRSFVCICGGGAGAVAGAVTGLEGGAGEQEQERRSVAYLCAYFAFFYVAGSITLLGMQIYGVSQNNCYCVFNFCLICVF